MSALVVEDIAIGGRAGTPSRGENYMGFPTGISGADLVWRGQVQAMKFGTRFAMPLRVETLGRLEGGRCCATFSNGRRVGASTVVIATGVQFRRLPIARLADFEGAGDEKLAAVTIRRGDVDETVTTCAVFVMVGAVPNTAWLTGLVRLDDKGFVLTGTDVDAASPYAASCPGIFAVGDVRAGSAKRVAASVGEGSVAISHVWEHVHRRENGARQPK